MKRSILILVLCLIGLCGSSETLLQPFQVMVKTNDYTIMTPVGCTNLQDLIRWTATNWPNVQTGSCTNWQTNKFTVAYYKTPVCVATWSSGWSTNSFIYLHWVTKTSCVFGTSFQTNMVMNWMAR